MSSTIFTFLTAGMCNEHDARCMNFSHHCIQLVHICIADVLLSYKIIEMVTSTHFQLHFSLKSFRNKKKSQFFLLFNCFFNSFPFLCCCFYSESSFSSSPVYWIVAVRPNNIIIGQIDRMAI